MSTLERGRVAAERRLRWMMYRRTSPAIRDALRSMSQTQLRYAVTISTKHRYVYVDNPKTGCSTIKALLAAAELGVEPADLHHRSYHTTSHSPFQRLDQMPGLDPVRYLIDEQYYFFTFVRNPFTRLRSAYTSKIQLPTRHKAPVLAALGLDETNLDQSVTFEQFVTVATAADDFTADPHWRSQTSQILHSVLPFNTIGRFEDFDEQCRQIFADIGLGVPQAAAVPQINASSAAATSYTPALTELVAARYQSDFENFDYSTDWSGPTPDHAKG